MILYTGNDTINSSFKCAHVNCSEFERDYWLGSEKGVHMFYKNSLHYFLGISNINHFNFFPDFICCIWQWQLYDFQAMSFTDSRCVIGDRCYLKQ